MKKKFNPANLCPGQVRCFYFNHPPSGHFLILIYFIILILPVFNRTEGEIKKKIKIRSKSQATRSDHAPRPTHHFPTHA
jgi:hypothetical protein